MRRARTYNKKRMNRLQPRARHCCSYDNTPGDRVANSVANRVARHREVNWSHQRTRERCVSARPSSMILCLLKERRLPRIQPLPLTSTRIPWTILETVPPIVPGISRACRNGSSGSQSDVDPDKFPRLPAVTLNAEIHPARTRTAGKTPNNHPDVIPLPEPLQDRLSSLPAP